MNEAQAKPTGTTEPKNDANSGVQQKPTDIIGQAREEREKFAAERERMEKVLAEIKELRAMNILGGVSDGNFNKEEKKEIDPIEYAQNALAGKFNTK